MLSIDGSQGEGGGQVLRTSLSLAAITGTAFHIEDIRARRARPGLLRQHLTAVRAAAEVCDAELEGAELGSRALRFRPRRPRAGDYRFAVGTAGSACLVCQTVLPILLFAEGTSSVTFEGGTHNVHAPPYDFLEFVYFPVLRRFGVELESRLHRVGFYPAGGGRFGLRLEGALELRPLTLVSRDAAPKLLAWTLTSRLPDHVAERELSLVREGLALGRHVCRAEVVDAHGPGNVLCISIESDTPELVTAFGEPGKRAEQVAEEALVQAREYLARDVPVGVHLADQLLLPLALAGGRFRTGLLSLHARTNVDVIRTFLGSTALQLEQQDEDWLVTAPGTPLARLGARR